MYDLRPENGFATITLGKAGNPYVVKKKPSAASLFFFSGASAPPRPVPCRAGKKKKSTRRTPKKKVETLNGRLPFEHGFDRRETLAKRVSDDLQLVIFRCRKTFFGIFLSGIDDFFKKVAFWRSYEFVIRVGRCVVKSH